MSKSLKQKTRFTSIVFTIEDAGLLMSIKTRQSESEMHFPFEQIKTNRATALNHNSSLLAIAGIFTVVALLIFIMRFSDKTIEPAAAPLWLTVSIILFAIYHVTKAKKLYLQTTEKAIEFYFNKADKECVNTFVDQLLQERNLYLVSKYGNLNRNLEYGPQLDNLNWLLNNRAISKIHYDEKVQELSALFNMHLSNKPIGFSSNN